jgi:hypothetical protein
VVDEVADTVDAVVKPLPRLLRALPVYAGTTILGDGCPVLVLDVAGIAGAARVGSGSEEQAPVTTATELAAAQAAGLLLATAPDGGRLAVRVAQVRRLEVFTADRVERVGDAEVVQYGDQILPLVRVARALRSGGRSSAPQCRRLPTAPWRPSCATRPPGASAWSSPPSTTSCPSPRSRGSRPAASASRRAWSSRTGSPSCSTSRCSPRSAGPGRAR